MFRLFALFFLSLNFLACSDVADGSSEPKLYPVSAAGAYQLFPNDSAANDSAEAWLSQGVFLRVQPEGAYALSFDAVTSATAPVLHIFRVVALSEDSWRPVWIKSVEARLENGRWHYDFECAETEASEWSVVLESDGDYWSGPVQNLHFAGQGSYSDTLRINLIVAGDFGGFSDSVSLDEVSALLLQRFRSDWGPVGVVIDTLVVRRASAHPSLGSQYPDDKEVLANYDSYGISTDALGGWPEDGLYNALDLVLVHRFADDGLLGLSPLYGGSLGGGDGSSVALATHYLEAGVSKQTSSTEWISTAIHEASHFFGLRHTTSSYDDVSGGDLSNLEDGLSDTPYCGSVLGGGWSGGRVVGRFKAFAGVSTLSACGDASNLMFPFALEDVAQTKLTSSQQQLVKASLELFPH